MISIFTPTYNRAHLLANLFGSLQNQTCKEFEWIVVDDGSADDTESVVENFSKEADFFVRYIKVFNGGKHRAINKGLEAARGEYFFVVDSDDTLCENAVERVLYWFGTIKDEKNFCGVGGLRGFAKDKINGTTFEGEYCDCTATQRAKHNINGDKAEAFYTDVFRKFAFPEFEGEKFVPEALVYNRMAAAGLKMRWYNEIVYLGDYLPDGYSANTDRLLINNWKGYSLYVKEVIRSDMKPLTRILIGGAWCVRGLKRLWKKQ